MSFPMTMMLVVPSNNMTNGTHPSLVSYVALSVATLVFGVNLVPLKEYETGDGFFFQFIYGLAVWSSGFVVCLFTEISKFYWLVLFGGMIWALCNTFTVPAIQLIGIGLATLLWNTAGLLVGWAVPRFGL
jgi:hypothetical protein